MSDATPTNEPAVPAEQPLEPAPTSAPAQAAETGKQQSFDADYVAKIRAEAAKYRTEAKANAEAAKRLAEIEESTKTEAQKQAEQLAKLREENERLQSQMLKAQVAVDKGVPAELLSGTSEDELVASAERLLAFRGQQAAPEYGRSADASPTKPKQLTRADMSRMTNDQIVKADEAGLFDDLKAGRL
jgi:hypothetical protein